MSDWLEELKRRAAVSSGNVSSMQSSATSAASAGNPYATGFRQWDSRYDDSTDSQQQPKQQGGGLPSNITGAAVYDKIFGTTASPMEYGAPGTIPVASPVNGTVPVSQGGPAIMNSQAIAAPTIAGNFASMGIGPQAGVVAGTIGTVDSIKHVAQGNKPRTQEDVTLGMNPATAWAYWPAKFSNVWGGKSKDQSKRDQLRAPLKETGILDDKYNLKFSDGSSWNMGADGHAKFVGTDGAERLYYQVDLSNPLNGVAVAYADPLADMLGGSDNNMVEWYSNALMNGAKDQSTVLARAKELYGRLGITKEAAMEQIQKMQSEGKLAEDRANAYRNTINSLGLTSSSPSSGGTAGFSYDTRALAAEQKAARQQSIASQMLNMANQNNQSAMALIGNKPSAAQALSQTSSPTQNPGTGFASFESSLSNILL